MNFRNEDWYPAAQETIFNILKDPPPRDIPPHITKIAVSPIAKFLFWFGIAMSIFGITMITLGYFGFVRSTVQSDIIYIILLANASLPLVFSALAFGSIRRAKHIIHQGNIYAAQVLKIRDLHSRIGSKSYHLITVRFSPDGQPERTASASVDSRTLDFFIDTKNNQTPIDILYSPLTPKSVLFPDNLIYLSRYH